MYFAPCESYFLKRCYSQDDATISTLCFSNRKRARAIAFLQTTSLVAAEAPLTKKARTLHISATPQPKKFVSFCTSTVVIRTSRNTGNTWYNAQDYASFKQTMKTDLSAYKAARKSREKMNFLQHSVRGLEKYYLPSVHKLGKERSKARVRAILDQQSVQRALNQRNHDELGMVAQVFGTQACEAAVEQAALDAMILIDQLFQ